MADTDPNVERLFEAIRPYVEQDIDAEYAARAALAALAAITPRADRGVWLSLPSLGG